MRLNTLSPSKGSKSVGKRRGRGHSAGQGKTCGRGQKGQHARSGGYHKVGFEGGQMPLQRRLPKVGFTSRMAAGSAELRLHELELANADIIDIDALKNTCRAQCSAPKFHSAPRAEALIQRSRRHQQCRNNITRPFELYGLSAHS